MGETLQNLESVIARWERNGSSPHSSARSPSTAESLNYERLIARGRKAWTDKFDDYKRPQRKQARHRRGHETNGQIHYDPLSNLGEFKTQPIILPGHVITRRPMMGRCCECLIVSKKNFYSDNVPGAGFRNVLRVPEQSSKNNMFVRMFCHIIYALRRKTNHQYPDIYNDVLASIRVEEAIEKTAARHSGHDLGTDAVIDVNGITGGDFQDVCRQSRRKAERILQGMKASISTWLISITGWVLMKCLNQLLSSLVVHQGQMEMVKKAFMKNRHIPLLLLPLHRSHLDYIILTFILYHYDIQAPYVAAGDNLNIPFFGTLLKALGGFFIRRKLDKEVGRRDLLYRAVLHSYMSELVSSGQNIEFFLEGGRSRSGRVLHPKAGLLSVITETFWEGTIPDAYIVPVSISYERIVDGNFMTEQMGEAKKRETFWGALKAIFRVLRTNFGNVRVDLGQPFSLQEYMSVRQHTHDEDSGLSDGRLSGSNTSLYGTDVIAEEQRQTVLGLATHVLYNCRNTTALMSTNMVAFLLLTIYRQGISLSELCASLDWLHDEMMSRSRDVGYSGETEHVVYHALRVLGSDLVRVKPGERESDPFIVPNIDLPYVFDLSYYANVAAMVFTLDCIIATAVLASCDVDLTVTPGDVTLTVSKKDIIEKAEFLCTLLKFDFILVPPCTSVQTALVETLERFISKQLLHRPLDDQAADRSRTSRTAASYAFQSDSEDDDDEHRQEMDEKLEIHVGSADFVTWYPLLWNTLAPIIETYWVTACCLTKLLDQDREESEFTKFVHDVAKERAVDGVASFVESMSYDAVKSALLSYRHLRVTELYTINSLSMTCLRDSYTYVNAINDLVAKVEQFRL